MPANRSNYLPLPGNALPYYMVTQKDSLTIQVIKLSVHVCECHTWEKMSDSRRNSLRNPRRNKSNASCKVSSFTSSMEVWIFYQ